MKYIKITNYVSNVNRLSLEKLGMSTKRDNSETIGQFGSGIKFAPIAAIRKGMRWVFTGEDSKGEYTLEYIIKDDEGIPSVFYKYQDYEKPSSFSADAGILSWTDEFQIYREVVSNAIDENTLNGLGWDVDVVDVDEIVPVKGEFSVYITATDNLLEIHKNFDKYFCCNREPVYSSDNITLYTPIDETFRVYCKGILVFTSEKAQNDYGSELLPGMFDYNFDNLKLNEDRTVDGNWEMNYKILNGLSSISDANLVEIIFQYFINCSEEKMYETESITKYAYDNIYTTDPTWVNTFQKMYEDYVIIKGSDASFNALKTIESKGYKPIIVNYENVYTFMKKQSIPSADEIFGDSLKYEYTMDLENYPLVSQALDIVLDVLPECKKMKQSIGVYQPFEEDDKTFAITVPKTENGEREALILINSDYIYKISLEKMVSTIVHEWDHFSTGVGDGDMEGRMFRELADDKIGYLICKIYKLTHK